VIVLGRHRPLAHDAWNELAVRAAIEEIAADAIAHFDPDTFWPAHPGDDGVADGNPSFYWGATGVIWAWIICIASELSASLKTFAPCSQGFWSGRSPLSKAFRRPIMPSMASCCSATWGRRLSPCALRPVLADLVHARAEANTGLPIRELMWGMPGSMLAAIHMAEMTGETRWRGLFETQAARLLAADSDRKIRGSSRCAGRICALALRRATRGLRSQQDRPRDAGVRCAKRGGCPHGAIGHAGRPSEFDCALISPRSSSRDPT
jgi:hypothetical protein